MRFVFISCWTLLFSLSSRVESQSAGSGKAHRYNTTINVHEGTSLIGVLSPDGRRIALIILGEVFIADRGSGRAAPIFDPRVAPGGYDEVAWAPDSRRIALRSTSQNLNGLLVVDLASGNRTRVTTRRNFGSLTWTRSGKLLVTAEKGDSVELRTYPPLEGSPATLIGTLPLTWGFVSITPDERSVIFASPLGNNSGPLPETRIRVLDVQSGVIRDLSAAGEMDDAPTVSPDGKLIAFTSEKTGNRDIWVMDIDGTGRRQVTRGAVDLLLTPMSWTPESRSIVFAAKGRLHSVSIDGGSVTGIPFSAPFGVARWTGLRKPRIPVAGAVLRARGIADPEISPDGGRVAFAALGDIWIGSVAGGASQRRTRTPGVDETKPRWSPDGKSIAFLTAEPGVNRALNVEGLASPSDVKRFSVEMDDYAWSPDSRKIAFRGRSQIGWIDLPSGKIQSPAVRGFTSSLAGWSRRNSIVYSTAATVEDSTSATHMAHSYFELTAGDSSVATPIRAAQGVTTPASRWSHGLVRVAYLRADRGYWRDSSRLAKAVAIADPSPHSFSWSADGSRLLYLSNGQMRLLDLATNRARTLNIVPKFTVAKVPAPVVIRGVRIVDGRGSAVSIRMDVLLEGGRIARIVPKGSLRFGRSVRVIEAGQRILMPGLFDLHAHLFADPPSPEYLWYGVTSIRDVGTRGDWTQGQRERAWSGAVSPRIFMSGGQLTGFYELGDQGTLRRPEAESNPRSVAAQTASLRANGADIIKPYFRNNEFDALVADAAHSVGLPVTSHFISPGMMVRGQEGKEHSKTLYGGDGLTSPWREDMISLAKAANTCVTPTLAVYPTVNTRGRSALYPLDSSIFDEPSTATFMSPARRQLYRDIMRPPLNSRSLAIWEQRFRDDLASVGRMAKAGVRIGAGTDTAPEGRSLQTELELLVKAGLTPLEAIRAATYDAAVCVGVEDLLGSVEAGKLADLVLVDGDPSMRIQDASKVSLVFLGGRPVSRDELARLGAPKR